MTTQRWVLAAGLAFGLLAFGCGRSVTSDEDDGGLDVDGDADADADGDADSDTGSDGGTDAMECTAGVMTGDITITNQEEVSALAGYTGITGSLIISGTDANGKTEPHSLSVLSCLTFVGGDLNIGGTALGNLTGLDELLFVGGNLSLLHSEWVGRA